MSVHTQKGQNRRIARQPGLSALLPALLPGLLLAASVWAARPAEAQVLFQATVVAPGVVLRIGDIDPRGYYWDGRYWRDPAWWGRYGRGRLIHYGDIDDRGWRWDGDRWREPVWWSRHGGERAYGVPPGHRDWDDRPGNRGRGDGDDRGPGHGRGRG